MYLFDQKFLSDSQIRTFHLFGINPLRFCITYHFIWSMTCATKPICFCFSFKLLIQSGIVLLRLLHFWVLTIEKNKKNKKKNLLVPQRITLSGSSFFQFYKKKKKNTIKRNVVIRDAKLYMLFFWFRKSCATN